MDEQTSTPGEPTVAPSEPVPEVAPETASTPPSPVTMTSETETSVAEASAGPVTDTLPQTEMTAPSPETEKAQMGRNEPFSSAEPAPQVGAPAVSPAPVSLGRVILEKARAMIQGRKTKKLEKILAHLEKHGTISNDDVEKLLHVSDATATRYLSALEKDGRIVQAGVRGRGVNYRKA